MLNIDKPASLTRVDQIKGELMLLLGSTITIHWCGAEFSGILRANRSTRTVEFFANGVLIDFHFTPDEVIKIDFDNDTKHCSVTII